MMRVLMLTHNFPRHEGDPVGSFVLRLAVALRRHDIEVHVVAPSAEGLVARGEIEGIPVTRFRYAPRKLETLAYTGTMGAQVRQFWKARLAMVGFLASGYRTAMQVHRDWRAQVVHAHWWFPGGLVARAVRARSGLPFVVTMHGSDLRLAANAPGARALYRTVSSRAAAMTTVSSWLAEEATKLDPRVVPMVGPMPVVTELFHPGEARDDNRLLFIGKLTEQKGLHHLLRAMARMRTQATLDVVGAGRVEDSRYRSMARELGLDDRITWHPLLSQAELAGLYRGAAIHAIPAVDEGLGLTAIEALLSETPVVAFDSGGIGDIVSPGRSGILVSAGDVDGMATALDTLLADRRRRVEYGREGRRDALARFSPDAVATKYATLLRRVAR